MGRPGRRDGGVRMHCLCTADGARRTQYVPRPGRRQLLGVHRPPKTIELVKIDAIGTLYHLLKTTNHDTMPQHPPAASSPAVEEDIAGEIHYQDMTCNDSNNVSLEEDMTCNDANNVRLEEDHDDGDARSKQAALEHLACPRTRRSVLLRWLHRRVQEIIAEDADEPDSEDELIKASLMDAVGSANANFESALCSDPLSFVVPVQRADAVEEHHISFARFTITYLLTHESGGPIASAPSGLDPWALERTEETDVFFRPSSPLGKWRDKPCDS